MAFFAADSLLESVAQALAKAKPDMPASRRGVIATTIAQYGDSLGVDPLLIIAVATSEETREEPAVDRRALYEWEAIHQRRDAKSVKVPPVWDDLLNLAQSLRNEQQDWDKKGGNKLVLRAYFLGNKFVKQSGVPGFQDSEFLDGVKKLYDELVTLSRPPTEPSKVGASPMHVGNAEDIKGQPRFSDQKELYGRWIRFYNPRLAKEKSLSIAEHLLVYSYYQGLDARLVFAVIAAESNFNDTAVSVKGAQGLGQLMPYNSRNLDIQPFDIEENIMGTTFILKDLTSRYEILLALAAFNAGEGAVKKYNGIPPYSETQVFVRRVLRIYYRVQGKKSDGSNI
ncbi:MAG: lytic transglycosylase domain-containing protein [bacterium]